MRTGALLLLAACYHAAPANRDVALSWRGRTATEITDRWGMPAQRPGTAMVWSYSTTHLELPMIDGSIEAHPVAAVAHVDGPGVSGTAVAQATVLDINAMFKPGEIQHTRHDAVALLEPSGTIAEVRGAALHWGPPNDVNLHWGTIFGGHVGMGALANTSTPLPSGDLYLGGMLSPQLGLVGTYTFVSGSGTNGGAIGMAGGVAVQYWPVNRLWLRAGPAMLLAWDPGFANGRLEPGVTAAASYAFVKVGRLAVDVCLDLSGGPQTAFGTLGVGVNLN